MASGGTNGQKGGFSLGSFIGGVLCTLLMGLLINATYDWVKAQWAQHTTYHYSAPRPGCGDNAQGWFWAQATYDCPPEHLELTTATQPGTANAIFVDPSRTFPADYSAAVVISNIQPDACAGMLIRGDWQVGTGYAFLMCANGEWELAQLHAGESEISDVPQVGRLPSAQDRVYSVKVVSRGSRLELYINGSNLVTAVDGKAYRTTKNIDLLVTPSGYADFTDFVLNEE